MKESEIKHLTASDIYGSGRMTSARREIARVVASMRGAFTIENLAERMRIESPATGSVATLYRSVASMEASGYLERVGERDGSALYARCDSCDHHHHIICDGCGRTAKASCPVGPEFSAGAAAIGFTITRHEMTLYGLCESCQTTRAEF